MSGRSLAEFPERMSAKQVAEWMGISLKRFYRLDAEGNFLFAEHKPRIGRKSWSRARLQEWDLGTLHGLTARRGRSAA